MYLEDCIPPLSPVFCSLWLSSQSLGPGEAIPGLSWWTLRTQNSDNPALQCQLNLLDPASVSKGHFSSPSLCPIPEIPTLGTFVAPMW